MSRQVVGCSCDCKQCTPGELVIGTPHCGKEGRGCFEQRSVPLKLSASPTDPPLIYAEEDQRAAAELLWGEEEEAPPF